MEQQRALDTIPSVNDHSVRMVPTLCPVRVTDSILRTICMPLETPSRAFLLLLRLSNSISCEVHTLTLIWNKALHLGSQTPLVSPAETFSPSQHTVASTATIQRPVCKLSVSHCFNNSNVDLLSYVLRAFLECQPSNHQRSTQVWKC